MQHTSTRSRIFPVILSAVFVTALNLTLRGATQAEESAPENTGPNSEMKAAALPGGSISGIIFYDLNGNGTLDTSEPGKSAVKMALLDAAGEIIATTVTNEEGYYFFNVPAPGTYAIAHSGVTTTFQLASGQNFEPSQADGKSPIGKSPIGKSPIGKSPIGMSPIGDSPVFSTPFQLGSGQNITNFNGAILVDRTPLRGRGLNFLNPLLLNSQNLVRRAVSPFRPGN